MEILHGILSRVQPVKWNIKKCDFLVLTESLLALNQISTILNSSVARISSSVRFLLDKKMFVSSALKMNSGSVHDLSMLIYVRNLTMSNLNIFIASEISASDHFAQ